MTKRRMVTALISLPVVCAVVLGPGCERSPSPPAPKARQQVDERQAPKAASDLAGGTVYSATDGVNIVMILDTSGSMAKPPKAGADRRPKIQIAKEAALKVLDDLKDFNNVNFGLMTFDGKGGVRQVAPLAGFDHQGLRTFIGRFNKPDGNTPIGEALVLAKSNLDRMPGEQSRNILLITDGENTTGRTPEQVVPVLLHGEGPGLYVVGFDLNPDQASTFGVLRDRCKARYYDAKKGEDLSIALAEVFFGQGGILAEAE